MAPSILSSGRLSRFPALVDHACVVGFIPDFYLQAGRLLMTRRLTLAFLSVIFVYGLSIDFAPRPALAQPKPAPAAKCDMSTCLDECYRNRGRPGLSARMPCGVYCASDIEDGKKKGTCK